MDLLNSFIEVRNKVDLLNETELEKWKNKGERDDSVLISSVSSIGINTLLSFIDKKVSKTQETIDVQIN